MRRYSQIWNFFELNAETPNRADCKLCGAKVSRGGRRASDYTTTNLISHLWLHHKVAYQEYRKRQKVHTAHVTSSTHPHHHAVIGAIAGGGAIIGDPVGSSGSSGSAGSVDDFLAAKRWCVEAGEEVPPVLVGVPSGAGTPVGAGGAADGSGAVDYFSASPNVPSAVVVAAANGSEGGPHNGLVEMKFCINEVKGNVSNVSMEIPSQFQHHTQHHQQHHQHHHQLHQQQQRPQHNYQLQVRGHTRGRPMASPRTLSSSSSAPAPAFAPFCAMRVVPLDCKMVEMVAQDGRPLSCVRDAGFRRLLAHLSPGYRPGSPALLAERVVPDVLAALRARLLCLLGGARSVALSARTLRAGDGEPWLLMAAHWRQQQQQRRRQGCRRRALVRCAPTDFAPPRAAAVAKELQKAIFWGVRRVSVLLVCGGGAGDFADDAEAVGSAEELAREASALAALPAAPCASHLLRVAVARGALALAATERLLLALRGRHAGRGDADSRPPPAGAAGLAGGWTSAYRLLRSASACRHKQGGGGATGTNWSFPRLSASQERLLQLLALLLRPVAEVARELARPDATLGAAIPLLRVLLRSLAAAPASSGERRTLAADDARGSGGGGAVEEEEDEEGLRAGLLAPLGRALEALESCRCAALATVLDPRFKCAFFSGDVAAARARAWLLEDAGVGGGDDGDDRDGAGHGGAARGGAGGSSEIWSRFEEVIAEHRPAGARLSPAEEVTVYLLEPPVERTRCPHAWWGAGDGAEDAAGAVSAGGDCGGGSRFPRLGRLARRLLAAPPTCGCGDGDGEEDDGGGVGDGGDGGGDDAGDCVWGQRVPRSWHGELGAALLVIRHGLPAVDYAY
ncbi:uncharacterized protein LOC144951877 [Lampetra fluviatilis]